MYAIVEIAGQQFKVEKDQKIYVHRLEGQEGAQVAFDKVLLIDNNGDIKVGVPVVEGASINAQILAHLKGDKVLIFKKFRRKGYQKLNGHRQCFTQIQINEIVEAGGASKAKKSTKKASAEEQAEA
jgi:large subunit ribosomal protein L21